VAGGRGTLSAREGELVCVNAFGACGFGEATPVAGFGTQADFRRSALECARRDAAAREAGEPLAEALAREAGTRARRRVAVARLVVGDGESLCDDARRGVAAGYATLKLKVDGRLPDVALARVASVRKALGERVALRVDANASFEPAAAAAFCRALAELGVEYLEEPVVGSDLAELVRLRAIGAVPIATDESACTRAAAQGVLDANAADVLVLKPSVLGLGDTLAVAQLAEGRGVRVAITSALDGAIARAAASAAAAAMPGTPLAAGLATGDRLADDLAELPEPSHGGLDVPPGPGLGITPDPAAIERLRAGPDRELAS
jgi:L-alanine-DL-glutamate epimerase-like enolase superfamily enzyme